MWSHYEVNTTIRQHYFTQEVTQAARWRAAFTGYTANTMSADVLATLGVRASAVMLLIPKARIFLRQHQKN